MGGHRQRPARPRRGADGLAAAGVRLRWRIEYGRRLYGRPQHRLGAALLLEVLRRQFRLCDGGVQFLRRAAELQAAQPGQLHLLGARALRVQFRFLPGDHRRLHGEQCPQRVRVVWQNGGGGRHAGILAAAGTAVQRRVALLGCLRVQVRAGARPSLPSEDSES